MARGASSAWMAAWLTLLPASVCAQGLVSIEASGSMPVGAPQSDRFGVGGAGSVAGYLRLAPWLLPGLRLRGGLFGDGDPPPDGQVDPSMGTLSTASAMLRLRPFASGDDPRNAVGLFLEGGGGGAVTGKLVRAAFEAGLGYGFSLGDVSLAPTARYVQVIQPQAVLSSADAHVAMIGLELTVLDDQPEEQPSIVEPVAVTPPAPVAPPDRDRDGIADANDACPQQPEDRDNFQDEDGCPEADNDGDQIADAADKCPDAPEDKDAFDDEDGCPDPDNDHDGFLDADDQCPLEAEIINGNKDYDGCKDEGLIELRNDRIVLEERVLFDSERSRIKTAGHPVLNAIIRLYKQHPEWTQIRIEGHADSRGNAAFNQDLSVRRAERVRDELIRLGIPAAMIQAEGYGSTKPRDLREEDEAYQRNRRVEFVVVSGGAAPAAAAPEGAVQQAPAPSEPAPPPAPAPHGATPP